MLLCKEKYIVEYTIHIGNVSPMKHDILVQCYCENASSVTSFTEIARYSFDEYLRIIPPYLHVL